MVTNATEQCSLQRMYGIEIYPVGKHFFCSWFTVELKERLIEVFDPLLREKSISRDAFVRILDHLHITYSDKRGENNNYHH